jgi:hypothetical protein
MNPLLSVFKMYVGSILEYMQDIQGDSGGKASILGGDSIGHCEKKKVHMNMCLILNGY